MGEIVKNFNEYHNVNEGKQFKNFIDIAYAAEDAYGFDMDIKKTKRGFTYIDIEDNLVEVIVKSKKASIVDGEQNMSIDDFANIISGGDVSTLYEGKKIAKISKHLKKSIEKYHDAQLKLQELQKEFISTPKKEVVKREILKKKLIAANKEVKSSEEEFRATMGQEDIDDIEIIW